MKFVLIGLMAIIFNDIKLIPSDTANKSKLDFYFGRDYSDSIKLKRFFSLSDCDKLDILDSFMQTAYDSSAFYKFPGKRPITRYVFWRMDSIMRYFIDKTHFSGGIHYGFAGLEFPVGDNCNQEYKTISNAWRRSLRCSASSYNTSKIWQGHSINALKNPILSYVKSLGNCEKLDKMVGIYHSNKYNDSLLFFVFYFGNITGVKPFTEIRHLALIMLAILHLMQTLKNGEISKTLLSGKN